MTHIYKGIKIDKVYMYGHYYYRLREESNKPDRDQRLHTTLKSAKQFIDNGGRV